MSATTLPHYLHVFTHLRTDRTGGWTALTRGQAPHKPFLLLSVLDLFDQGRITANRVELTAELGGLFSAYWDLVMPPERRGNLALPFFHLRSSKFWHLLPRPGLEQTVENVRQVDTLGRLKKLVLGARLDDELYVLLQAAGHRATLRTALVQTYFAPEVQAGLVAQSEMNMQAFLYSQELLKHTLKKTGEQAEPGESYQAEVRDRGFRQVIVRLYDHRCAFCGVKMLTTDGRSVVDAAHIIPWSISHDDDPRNGMALCRLCHWTFDQGLLGVSDSYLLLLSGELRIDLNVPGHLLTLERRSILGPAERDLWPAPDSLAWHRKEVFRRS